MDDWNGSPSLASAGDSGDVSNKSPECILTITHDRKKHQETLIVQLHLLDQVFIPGTSIFSSLFFCRAETIRLRSGVFSRRKMLGECSRDIPRDWWFNQGVHIYVYIIDENSIQI